MRLYLVLLVLITNNIFAGTKEYVIGSGSQFKFSSEKGGDVNLNIYITESSFSKLGIEYFFSSGGFLGVEAWQQYILGLKADGLSLDEGYVQSPTMTKPEIMTKEFRENNENGVKVEDFFFSKESEIEKYKVGIETVEVPAGSILCSHYQKKRAEQTVDFWISDKAGAIGLVKLVSKGLKDQTQNYTIELQSLLINVRAKINSKDAVPLTEKGRMFLGKKTK
jgi:hypothetical protein